MSDIFASAAARPSVVLSIPGEGRESVRYYLGVAMQLVGIAGILAGGWWAWMGVLELPLFTLIDPVLPEDPRPRRISNGIIADLPLLLAAILGPVVFFTLAWKLGHGGLAQPGAVGMIATAGWLAVVPTLPVTHELYHRREPFRRNLGTYLQVQYTDCTRGFLHIFGHHLYVATSRDADTAPRGESIYRFTIRMVVDNYRELFRLERETARKLGRSMWSWRGRMMQSIAIYVLFLAVLAAIGGWPGLIGGFIATIIARALVESFNYIQHCGLIRLEGQPVASRHVWNHLAPLTRAAAFEITNHTGHHLDSYVPFYKLQPDVGGLRMPSAYLCFAASLMPPVWNRFILWPRLENWDRHVATPEERALAREANRKAGWPDWLGDGRHAFEDTVQRKGM
jgi:fatty acid desaturase